MSAVTSFAAAGCPAAGVNAAVDLLPVSPAKKLLIGLPGTKLSTASHMQSTATIANTAAAMTMVGPLTDNFGIVGIADARRRCCG